MTLRPRKTFILPATVTDPDRDVKMPAVYIWK